jgi:hypothetical protein
MAIMTNQLFCPSRQQAFRKRMCRLSPHNQKATKKDAAAAGDVRARSQTSQHKRTLGSAPSSKTRY